MEPDMKIKMNHKCFPSIYDLDQGRSAKEEEIETILDYINQRYDCADFRMVCIIRSLYAYSALLSETILRKMKEAVLNFKYWLDEAGEDSMCYWSENHYLLFATIEYLAGSLYPEAIFTNNQMTGRERKERARKRLQHWFSSRYTYGFVEWHSNTYYEEDIAPLSLLIDFADDEEIRFRATVLLDLLLLDLATHNYRGYFVATSGRCYEAQKKDPRTQDVLDIMKKAFGIGPVADYDYTRLSADFVLNKTYVVPQVLKEIAISQDTFILKEALGMELRDVPKVFYAKEDPETAGGYLWTMEAFTNPEAISLTLELFHKYRLHTNSFLKELKAFDNFFLKKLRLLPLISRILNPVTNGVAIEKAHTYTFRHRDYFLSTAQDYHPRAFGDQQHIWQATLGEDITVFSTHPGTQFFEENNRNFSPGYWVGNGINPYGFQERNLGLYYYDLSPRKGYLEKERSLFTHLYFPTAKFDHVYQEDKLLVAISGRSLIAISSLNPLHQKNEHEFIQEGLRTAWGVMVESTENISFDDFLDLARKAEVSYEKGSISYKKLSILPKRKAEYFYDSKPANIRYKRYESDIITTSDDLTYTIKYKHRVLKLNLEKGLRKHD
jgi:hypothetical protein